MNYRSILIATVQTIGLFVAGFVIPLLGQVIALFTPVPLILIYVREGKREGMSTLIFASAVIALLGGWQAAAILFFSFGLMAIGISEGMRRNWKPEQTTLLGGFLPIAVMVLIVVFYIARIGKSPIGVAEEYLRGSVAEAAKLYTSMGLKEMAEKINSVSDAFIYYLVRLIPGILIATSVVQAACCYGIARSIIQRRSGAGSGAADNSLVSWHAPDSWVWGLIAALALVVLPQEAARIAGWNLAILFAIVYLAQGAAIVEHYLRKAGITAVMRGLILALILALPSIVFVIALGVVDIWGDFRKVRGPVPTA
jgi:uncharacterized protein YybS (DUF2232 family)